MLLAQAAVNLVLGNNRKVIDDCEAAVRLQPSNTKAYWRGCAGCTAIGRHGEAIEWLDRGLLHDPSNARFVAERARLAKIKATADKKERMRAARERKERAEADGLAAAIAQRGIRLEKGIEFEMKQRADRKGEGVAGGTVRVDERGLLHWRAQPRRAQDPKAALTPHRRPVTLLYPEHRQTDFITDFCEGNAFEDHLNHMFPEDGGGPPWDAERKYVAPRLEVYFEVPPKAPGAGATLVRIPPERTLLEVSKDPRFVIVDMTPAFIVLVRDAPFSKQFLREQSYSGDEV